MDAQLRKETVTMEQVTAHGASQAVVEGEITLPGGLREETHVLHAGGMAVVDSAESGADRATLSGKVIFHVLYTQGAPNQVHVVEATADFIHQCDLSGAQPKGRVQAQARVEHVDASVQGGRLNMRAIVQLDTRGASTQALEVLTGVNAPGGAEVATQEIALRRTVASGQADTLLREEFELPEGLQVRETLCADAAAQISDITGGQGRIGVEGTVTISAVHASDLPGKPIVVTHHEAPFSQTLELSGESGDLLDARVTVRDVAVASQDAGDGGKTLRAEVLLGVQGTADTQEKLTVLRDAYTYQGAALTFSGRDVVIRTGQRRASAAESGKTTLLLPDGTPPVRGMLAAFATPIMTAQDSTGSRLNTEGMLEITLLYMTDENTAPVTVHQETPFRTSFAVSAAPDSILTLTADEVEATPITSDRVELRYVLRLTCDGVETQSAHLLTDAQEEAADEVDDGLYLCYCQTGEDWWTLAKEYRVPQEKLRRLNPDLPDALKAGTGVVVWKKSQ